MLKNYLKIAFRNIFHNKGFALLNIVGLTIGITCAIFVFLYVQYELSFDKFHKNNDKIYRVVLKDYIGTPGLLGPCIEKEIPEISKTVRMSFVTKSTSRMFGYENKKFNEKRFLKADPAFFEVFSFDFIKGRPETALKDPNSIVITESMANKYFEDRDPIGKILRYEDETDYIVTGVIKDVPDNSHFKFDFVAQFPNRSDYPWGGFNFLTYLLLSEKASPDDILNKIGEVFKKNSNNKENPFQIQKITDIHLQSNIRGEIGQNGNMSDIYIYSIVAFIILIIACINYTNLIISHFTKRTKEIGVRKVLGANRSQLVKQFLSESLILIFISTISAIILFEVTSPLLNQLINRSIHLSQIDSLNIILELSGVFILAAIIAGIYPAIYLASFNPVEVFKNNSIKTSKGAILRKGLVILQFSFSTFFILFMLVIWKQMNFLSQARLGFNKDHVLNIQLGVKFKEEYKSFRTELLKFPEIENVSFNDFLLSGNNWNQSTWWEGRAEDDWDAMRWIPVDENFIKTFQLKLSGGNDFSPDRKEWQYILNESAVKYIGWKDPVGKKFDIQGKGEVVGVVEDYNTKSLHNKILPCALIFFPNNGDYLSIRLASSDISGTIKKIENLWKSYVPDRAFDFFFFDDDYNSLYKNEETSRKIFTYAALLAIIISCLGLLGLISLSTEKRTKEIAIRRVLGSSVSSVVMLLSKELTIWILASNIIAFPIGYYFIDKWLQTFAYRVNIDIWVFLISGIITLVITFAVMSFKTVRAAVSNPVKSLKYE